MRASLSMIKGFLLEESLAKLLENSGYTLINSSVIHQPDKYPEFVMQGNGLNIKGRGGIHQADVLGQFPISIPFNYPVRLFLEAKFRSKKTGIDTVRSGIGILTDLNSNYRTIDLNGIDLLTQRFNYQYAIFSTSGFSENAMRLAIAYRISLIDLSGRDYADLLNVIDTVSRDIKAGLDSNTFTLHEVRTYIRSQLFYNVLQDENRAQMLRDQLNPLFTIIQRYGDLYLASINSPFTILLKPSSPEVFRRVLERNRESTYETSIVWDLNDPDCWRIELNNSNDELVFEFYLPELIKKYIFFNKDSINFVGNSLNAKNQYFESMVFYVRSAEKFITFKYKLRERV